MKFEIQIKKIDKFKSIEKISDSLKIRKKVFCEEQTIDYQSLFQYFQSSVSENSS